MPRSCQKNRRTFRAWSLMLLASSAFSSLSESLPEVANVASQPSFVTVPLTRKKVPVVRSGKVVSHKTSYAGIMHVGMPRQEFRVVFDTGSGHVVLPGTECKSQQCTIHRRYIQENSPDAVEVNIDLTPTVVGQPYDEVTVNYGTGQITGVFVNESICVGETVETELCADMGFIKANHLSHHPFAYFPVDGLFGLGLKSLALSPFFNFFNVVAESDLVKVAQFSMYIGEGDHDSELTFGGYNPMRLASPLQWSPVAMPEMGHWQIMLKAIRIGDYEVELCKEGDCRAIFDTGTTHLGVPSFTEKTMEKMLSVPANGMENCLHAEGIQISFEFSGFNLTLGPDSYMRRLPLSNAVLNGKPLTNSSGSDSSPSSVVQSNLVNDSKVDDELIDIWCRPLLMPITLPKPLGPNIFILGEPLLRRYYTVFDWSKPALGFGLAAPKHQAVDEDPVIFMQQSVRKADGSFLVQVTMFTKRKTEASA